MRIKRTQRELNKPVPLYRPCALRLDGKKLHRDLIKKLNAIDMPQAYLTQRLGIARSILWRISVNKEITLSSLLRLVDWLDEDLDTYVRRRGCKGFPQISQMNADFLKNK